MFCRGQIYIVNNAKFYHILVKKYNANICLNVNFGRIYILRLKAHIASGPPWNAGLTYRTVI